MTKLWQPGSAASVQTRMQQQLILSEAAPARLYGDSEEEAWAHFAFQTEAGARLTAIWLDVAMGKLCRIPDIIVRDGGSVMAHLSPSLKGEQHDTRLEIPGGVIIRRGITVALRLWYGAGSEYEVQETKMTMGGNLDQITPLRDIAEQAPYLMTAKHRVTRRVNHWYIDLAAIGLELELED